MQERLSERVDWWRARDQGDLDLLHATYLTYRFDRHFHDTYAIGVLLAGDYRFAHIDGLQKMRPGDVAAVNPGDAHDGYAFDQRGWTYRMVYPGVTLMRQIARDVTGRDWRFPTFARPVMQDAHTARLILAMHCTLKDSASQLERDTAVRMALGTLITRHAVEGGAHPTQAISSQMVARAVEYLHAHIGDAIRLDDLATACACSPYHLVRTFRMQMGLPPHKYLASLRVERARTLLAGGYSLADTALEIGFSDQPHLNRWFKRVMGITPGQYARP